MIDHIIVTGANTNNLKNITVAIPKNQLVILTGLSGSGKSTLAFETLHKEGQRQYMESLGMVTERVQKPAFATISGLSPSISVDQNNLGNRSPRSTVGTLTEIYTYLRLLYARIGHRPCKQCGEDVPPPFHTSGIHSDRETYPCPHCQSPVLCLDMAHFSFNSPLGACPTCTGLGTVHKANLHKVFDKEKTIAEGAVLIWDKSSIKRFSKTLQNASRTYDLPIDLAQPLKEWGGKQMALLLYGVRSPQFRRHFPTIEPPTSVAKGNFEGVVTNMLRRYDEHIDKPDYRQKMEKLLTKGVCPECQGERLRAESRVVTAAGWSLAALTQLPISELGQILANLELSMEEQAIFAPVLHDLQVRIERINNVGVGYLTLNRHAATLSAGESQRLRLAVLLGSGLTGVLYVLDEPTVGLHAHDTRALIQTVKALRDLGNTVLVIEHDLEMVRAADHVIELGPGAGEEGGELVVQGTAVTVASHPQSPTGGFLSGRVAMPPSQKRTFRQDHTLTVQGARANNLQNLTVNFPLKVLTAVTGVSGSGKSSLLLDIVGNAAAQRFHNASEPVGDHDSITGWEHISKVLTIDQVPIGRTPRSNAATYSGAFTAIRQAFAETAAARKARLTARHFSFNVPGGRCDRCEGAGVLSIKMHFMPEGTLLCPACRGKRYKPEVLKILYQGYSIADILDMSIKDALPVFEAVSGAATKLEHLVDVGVGYLRLGQPATTLSGGEAQRVKLATELSRRSTKHTLYLLDEPTTGLHAADVAKLLRLLQKLVAGGNTVIVIEHNLDVIQAADWIIDLGPEGGKKGGQLMAAGTPDAVAACPASITGQFLAELGHHASHEV